MNPGSRLARFWRTLGPGLITGAADDDPSGIVTLAGAQFGTGCSGSSDLWR
jgi:Mn2+/Fe2+ NRAMP family transporter